MNNKMKFNPVEKKSSFLLISVLTFFIIIAGYFYYNNEEVTIRQQKTNELKAIAELKINQISEWYKDEFLDAGIISHNTLLVERIAKAVADGDEEKSDLPELFSDVKDEHGYSSIILTTIKGEILNSTDNNIHVIDTFLLTKIEQAVKTKSVTAMDLHRISFQESKISLGFISPVLNKNNDPIAVIVFLFEADDFLYPLIQYWPVPSLSSESFIFRIEGDSVLYLNELKLQKDTALKLKLPITRKDLPAVQAALGKKGIFEGKDYRGVDVFAYISSVPSTPWYIIAKIDKSELFEGLESELLNIVIITILFILIAGAGISLIYSHRQRNVYKELYDKEKELWQSKEKFNVTIDSLGEGVITADLTGKIQYLNRMAQELTGWNLREAKGRKLSEIYSVKNELTGQKENNIVQKVLKQGIVKELANHTLLISKRGEEIPVMDTGAPIYDNSGTITGLVLTFQDETEKRRQKHILEENERRFRSTLDNMLEGCQILGFDWRYLYINAAAAKHNKRPAEELLGNRYMDMWPGIERTEVFALIKECLNERIGHVMENEFVFPDGSIGWFELKIQPIPDGVFILSYDITERKRVENEHKKLSKAIIQSPISVVITDTKGNIEYANPKFSEVTGYSNEEIIGKNPRFLKSGTHPEEFYKNMWDTILSGNEWKGEIQNRNKNGELYWDYVLISPIINELGVITHFVELKEDITERKKMVGDLIAAKEKAEEINKVKAHFFANMSHELRTPFVGIMGYAELLSEILIDPEEREMAVGILNTSKRMKETLTKILSLSKFEFNGIEAELIKVDVARVINNVYKQFAAAAERKNLLFKNNINFKSLFIETDEALLAEILNNLVSNAVVYTNEGEIILSADIQTINGKNALIVKVKDTGIGIPKDKQEIIWEEFRQASEGFTRNFQGTGLGLSIARKYAGLLGCRIYLESEEGKGSTFILEIPFIPETTSDRITNKITDDSVILVHESEVEYKAEKRTILYVEDDEVAIDVMSRALSKKYIVESVTTAEDALSKVKANKYGAILMDINLGHGTSGDELTQIIRKIKGYETTPIIAATAYASDSDKKEFLSKGMSHYISKPFTLHELMELLEKVFAGE